MNILSHFKTKSKFIKYIMVILLLLVIVTSIMGDSYTWTMLKLTLVVLPSLFTVDIISEVYEKKLEGMIFLTSTPLYKQFIKRFLAGILLGGIAIITSFSIAALGKLTTFTITSCLLILLSSIYIALLGVTFSNITKKSILGFFISIIFIGIFMTSSDFNERYLLISPLINSLYITQDFYLSNILSLTIMSLLLFYFNIFWLSKGEKIRETASILFLILFVIIGSILFGNFAYGNYERNKLNRIVGNLENETQYILLIENKAVKDFMVKKGFAYSEDINKIKGYKDKNIVIISDKKNLDLLNIDNLSFVENGINFDGKIILNGSAICIAKDNLYNKNKKSIFFISNNWNEKQLKMFFDGGLDNLVIMDDKDWLLKSKNTNIKNTNRNIELNENTWYTDSYENTRIIYRYMTSSEKKNEISKIWNIVYKNLVDLTKNNKVDNLLQLRMISNLQYDELLYPERFNIETLKIRFNSHKEGGKDWTEYITQEALEKILFKNISNSNMVGGFSDYIRINFIMPSLFDSLGEEYWKENIDKLRYYIPNENKDYYIKDITTTLNKSEFNSIYDSSDIAAYILNRCYEIDSSYFSKVLNDIYSSENKELEVMDIQNIIRKYYSNELDELFEKYRIADSNRFSAGDKDKGIPEEPVKR